MSLSTDSQDTGYDEAKVRGWYRKWRQRMRKWAERNSDSDIADILLLFPDLFLLCLGLIGDKRVPSPLKISLVSAIAYVLSPVDLIPEALFGVAGLIDDAGVLVIVLHGMFSVLDIDPDDWEKILSDHWSGDDDPVSIIKKLYKFITENAKKHFGRVWAAMQRVCNRPAKHDTSPKSGPVTITP